jgi:NAD kinase
MQPPKTIGIIINPKAGKGFPVNSEIARLAASRFQGAAIFTGPGETGAAAFYDDPRLVICDCGSEPGHRQTMTLASALAFRQVDLLLVIGGDGTLADVAYALVGSAMAAVPIMGIGAGSTNVGPLITCHATKVAGLVIENLETTLLPAALVKYQGALLGIGFNDCILGFTVIGTLDGQVRDLDARAKMQGLNLLGHPDLVGSPLTLVERVSPSGTVEVARGDWVSSVAIGFSDPAFFGKAVTGGICLASYLHIPAGCLVTDSPMVRMETTRQEVLTLGPVRSQYISFDETMYIRVSGMRPGTAVCADGNPLKILSPEDQVEFWVRPDAVQAVKSKQHH